MGQSEKKKMDTALFVLVLILAVCGLLLLYSTSAYNGRVKFHDPAYYFKKQLFATALGILGMCMVSRMDYRALLRFAPVLYLASLGLSAAVLFVGEEINGSRRWLSLGPLSFQPSEFAKVAVILFLAWVIQKTRSRTTSFRFMALVIVSGNDHRLCIQSQISSLSLDRGGGRLFYCRISQRGELPAGTACHLEKSGSL